MLRAAAKTMLFFILYKGKQNSYKVKRNGARWDRVKYKIKIKWNKIQWNGENKTS